MKVTCGHCGRKTEEGAFCEKCGAALAPAGQVSALEGAVAEAAEPPSGTWRRATGDLSGEETVGGSGGGAGRPLLEVDRMCVQFEGLVGTVRFRVDPRGYETVKLTMEDGEGGRRKTWGPRRVRERGEIRVQLDGQAAGCPTWTVRLECTRGGKRQSWEGDVDLVVARPREAQRVADNLKVEITNHITMGNASDAHVNQRALDGLEKLASAENPFDVLKEVVCGSGRSWARVDLYETSAVPAAAVRDRVALEWDGWRLQVFGGTEVRFGRERPRDGGTDFTLRPGAGGAREPYGRISRLHCTFARRGGVVELQDGVRTASGLRNASLHGTWWEGRRLGAGERVRLRAGTKGVASFAGTEGGGAVSMWAEAGESWMLLRRTDGVKEAFLMLWGDFAAARLDPAAGELELCRRDGGFFWRCAGEGGWLVPGEVAETPAGGVETGILGAEWGGGGTGA